MFQSCIPKKKLTYLIHNKDNQAINEYINIRPEKRIQPYDNIYINVSSIDEKTANIFENQNRNAGGINVDLISYTVDNAGFINFPFVGEIYIKNLTLAEAQKRIEDEVSQYLSNISINVKFINNRVAVLGEVQDPVNTLFTGTRLQFFKL